MTIAVCPGSFDPITLGHVDIARRTAELFDEVVVGVARNAAKSYLFDDTERVELARASVEGIPGVRVELIDGLLAEYCRQVGARTIVKGLRGAADFDAEQAMGLLNRHLSGVETLFLLGEPSLGHVASSYVKDIARHGGPIDDLVPAPVAAVLRERLGPQSRRKP